MPTSLEIPSIPMPPGPPPPGQVHPPMVFVQPVWEYKHLVRPSGEQAAMEESELNRLGSEGWELVAVQADGGAAHFYFKRLLR